MATLLRRGRPAWWLIHPLECPECHAITQLTVSDRYTVSGPNLDTLGWRCPCCHRQVISTDPASPEDRRDIDIEEELR